MSVDLILQGKHLYSLLIVCYAHQQRSLDHKLLEKSWHLCFYVSFGKLLFSEQLQNTVQLITRRFRNNKWEGVGTNAESSLLFIPLISHFNFKGVLDTMSSMCLQCRSTSLRCAQHQNKAHTKDQIRQYCLYSISNRMIVRYWHKCKHHFYSRPTANYLVKNAGWGNLYRVQHMAQLQSGSCFLRQSAFSSTYFFCAKAKLQPESEWRES